MSWLGCWQLPFLWQTTATWQQNRAGRFTWQTDARWIRRARVRRCMDMETGHWEWRVSSAYSDPGANHTVDWDYEWGHFQCECPSGRNYHPCWHINAVRRLTNAEKALCKRVPSARKNTSPGMPKKPPNSRFSGTQKIPR